LLECGDSLLSPFLSGDVSFSGTQETRKIIPISIERGSLKELVAIRNSI